VDVADPRDASGCLHYSISSRKASTEPKPLCPVSGEGGGVFRDMSPSPRPHRLMVLGRAKLCMWTPTGCNQMFLPAEHPQTRISIHRCYKL
jgi:hypothetical protein